jgi:hypothetical protein
VYEKKNACVHTVSCGGPAAERDDLVDLSGVDERADGGRLVGREQDLRLPGQLHHAGVDHDAGRGGVEPPEEVVAVDRDVEDAPAEGARRARVLEVERHVVGRRGELRGRPLHGELLAPAGCDSGLERLGRRLVPEVVGRDGGVALHHGVGVRERRPVPVVRVIWIARMPATSPSGFPGRSETFRPEDGRAYLTISPLLPKRLRTTVVMVNLLKSVVLYMESARSMTSSAEMKGLDAVSGRRARHTLMVLPCPCATISK